MLLSPTFLSFLIDEIGSGVFGECKKMLLSSTEVVVKIFNPALSSRDAIMYEAMVMSKVCNGHPNLPLFFGVYDSVESCGPRLVSKLYSVKNDTVTLHKLLTGTVGFTEQQWARILLGICNAVEAVHSHGFLHNDIKADNIVLSDTVPDYTNSPPLVPILIDFGKSRPIKNPKRYRLTEEEKSYYRIHHHHIAPEVIDGIYPQSVKSDVYSLGRIINKVARAIMSSSLHTIGQKCIIVNRDHRPLPIGLYAILSDCIN